MLGRLAAPAAGLAEMRFRSEQHVYLSDMQPKEVKETPFFDDKFPWQRDRSVSGGPLVVDGVTHEKGLGLHAECRMGFDLGAGRAR